MIKIQWFNLAILIAIVAAIGLFAIAFIQMCLLDIQNLYYGGSVLLICYWAFICKNKIYIKIVGGIFATILFIALIALVGTIISNPGYMVLAFFGWALWVFVGGILTGSIGLVFWARF